MISILAVIAKQERIRMSERTKAGMERARAAGRKLGRPSVELRPDVNVVQIARLRNRGHSWDAIAKRLGVSRNSIRRVASRAVQKGFLCSRPMGAQIQ